MQQTTQGNLNKWQPTDSPAAWDGAMNDNLEQIGATLANMSLQTVSLSPSRSFTSGKLTVPKTDLKGVNPTQYVWGVQGVVIPGVNEVSANILFSVQKTENALIIFARTNSGGVPNDAIYPIDIMGVSK